jgi:hypothetical protein
MIFALAGKGHWTGETVWIPIMQELEISRLAWDVSLGQATRIATIKIGVTISSKLLSGQRSFV